MPLSRPARAIRAAISVRIHRPTTTAVEKCAPRMESSAVPAASIAIGCARDRVAGAVGCGAIATDGRDDGRKRTQGSIRVRGPGDARARLARRRAARRRAAAGVDRLRAVERVLQRRGARRPVDARLLRQRAPRGLRAGAAGVHVRAAGGGSVRVRRTGDPRTARSGDLQHVPRRARAGCCAGEGRRRAGARRDRGHGRRDLPLRRLAAGRTRAVRRRAVQALLRLRQLPDLRQPRPRRRRHPERHRHGLRRLQLRVRPGAGRLRR